SAAGRVVSNLVHYRADRLLAGNEYNILARVAAVGSAPAGLSRHEPAAAYCGVTAGVAGAQEPGHPRRVFGSAALRRASGERRDGGVDHAAEDDFGKRLLLDVDA